MKEYWGKERKPIGCPFPQIPIPAIGVSMCRAENLLCENQFV